MCCCKEKTFYNPRQGENLKTMCFLHKWRYILIYTNCKLQCCHLKKHSCYFETKPKLKTNNELRYKQPITNTGNNLTLLSVCISLWAKVNFTFTATLQTKWSPAICLQGRFSYIWSNNIKLYTMLYMWMDWQVISNDPDVWCQPQPEVNWEFPLLEENCRNLTNL